MATDVMVSEILDSLYFGHVLLRIKFIFQKFNKANMVFTLITINQPSKLIVATKGRRCEELFSERGCPAFALLWAI